MTVVGITGTSGSGKSTVAGIIQQNYNAQIIDADQIAKELTQQDTEYLRKITKTFGEEILENGKLNRKKLADIIFSDKKQKEHNEKYIGKNLEVLFEEKEGEYYKGHTTNYIVVKKKTDEQLENVIKSVHIIDENNLELIGE